jgi:hypothetical protein
MKCAVKVKTNHPRFSKTVEHSDMPLQQTAADMKI